MQLAPDVNVSFTKMSMECNPTLSLTGSVVLSSSSLLCSMRVALGAEAWEVNFCPDKRSPKASLEADEVCCCQGFSLPNTEPMRYIRQRDRLKKCVVMFAVNLKIPLLSCLKM